MRKLKLTVSIVVLILGCTMIIIGLGLSQEKGVFYKAIMICMECIGIG